jgi:hypothetical protein
MYRSADALPVGCLLIASALAAAMPGVAAGQTDPPKISNDRPPDATSQYWTPERMKEATPMDMAISGPPRKPERTPPASSSPGAAGGRSK